MIPCGPREAARTSDQPTSTGVGAWLQVVSDAAFDEIRLLAAVAVAKPLPSNVFRARLLSELGYGPIESIPVAEFGAPPAIVASEGRYNHAGSPMLYLSDTIATTVAKIGAPGARY